MKIRKTFLTLLAASLVLAGCSSAQDDTTTEVKPAEQEEKSTADEIKTDETNTEQDKDTTTEASSANEEPVKPADAMSAYKMFLDKNCTLALEATVDSDVCLGYSDYEYIHAGEKLTFDSLYNVMKNSNDFSGNIEPVPYFSFLTIEDNRLLAIKFHGMDLYSANDDSFSVVIINFINEELHITHAYDSWGKNKVRISDRGCINTMSLAGAGETVYETGLLTEDGKYQTIYTDANLNYSWIQDAFGSEIYNEVYGSTGEEPQITVHKFDFGNETICTVEETALNDTDLKFLNMVQKTDCRFTDDDGISKRINDKCNELCGKDYDAIDNCPVVWNPIYSDDIADILPKSFGETSRWNYEDSVCSGRIADDYTLKLLAKADKKPLSDDDILRLCDVLSDLEASDTDEFVLVKTVGTQGSDDYFRLYMTKFGNSVILAPDGGLMSFDFTLCDYIYGNAPDMYPCDFDGDGKIELGLIPYIFHGTGFSQESLIILESTGDGYWYSDHLTPQEYMQTITDHLRFIDKGNEIEIIYDGESTGSAPKDPNASNLMIFLDDFVDIEFNGKNAVVRVNPSMYSDDNPSGTTMGTAKITYSADKYGTFEVSDFVYFAESDANKLLNDFAEGKITDTDGRYLFDPDNCYDDSLPMETAFVDVNNDEKDELIIREVGSIPYIYAVVNGEIRRFGTYCMGSAIPSMINTNHQIVHMDVTHANRQQYSVISYFINLRADQEVFFADWYEIEEIPESHEYFMVRDNFDPSEDDYVAITKEEFDELQAKYVCEDTSIEWVKRSSNQ